MLHVKGFVFMDSESVYSFEYPCITIKYASFTTTLTFLWSIGIDTNIEVIVVSLTTSEAHHSPRAVLSFTGR